MNELRKGEIIELRENICVTKIENAFNWFRERTILAFLLFICQIVLFFLTAPVTPCFAEGIAEGDSITGGDSTPFDQVEVFSFDSRDEAESFSKKLESSGYRSIIETEIRGTKEVHTVFILTIKGEQFDVQELSGESLPDSGEKGPAPDKAQHYESGGGPSWDTMGRRWSNIHGSLSLTGIYTDNVLNSRDNKKADFSTVLTPEIWLTVPGIKQKLSLLTLSPRAPGGFTLSTPDSEQKRRLSGYAYYRTDIPLSSSSGISPYGEQLMHKLGGGILYNGPRISASLADQYESSYHEREAGMVLKPGEQDRYDANRFDALLKYTSLNRLGLDLGYSNFIVRYASGESSFRDRSDDLFSSSVSYRLSPKMSLLAEYEYISIAYDQESSLDSSEHYFLGGLSWDITEKSKGLIKAGYVVKDFENGFGRHDDFSFEVQLDHRLTPRTSLLVSGFRKTSETNIADMSFSITNGFETRLQHMLSTRLTTSAGFLLTEDHYKDEAGLTESVESRTYQGVLECQYEFRRWLRGRVGYAYTQKDSSRNELEYKTNSLFFLITLSH
jgi:predicted porin